MNENHILLLGGSGYVGSVFCDYFEVNKINYRAFSRSELDYSSPGNLYDYLKNNQYTFLVNAAGYTGKPNVDACEKNKQETLFRNAILPGIISDACTRAEVPWRHISSGCIFLGRREDGKGFSESDTPNFSFRSKVCSFYSGTKALGEEFLADDKNCYIRLLRILFDNVDGPRNFLTKLLQYDVLLDVENSILFLPDAIAAAYSCWKNKISTGIYYITNPGFITTREVVAMIKEMNVSDKVLKFFDSESDFMKKLACTPRSSCILDSSNLDEHGIKMTEVHEALKSVLENWGKAS